MTAEEIGALLAYCAAFDARTVSEIDVIAWGEALVGEDPGLSLQEAKRRVVVYYRRHRDPIMPSDVLYPELNEAFWSADER